ncbi:MAG: aldehyde-activating protein [Pseudomonadota bacterium]
MKYVGSCHCNTVTVTFETDKSPEELGVRTCQCTFCRAHGAANISDRDGRVHIDCAESDIVRYCFALKTADFLICRTCGVYFLAAIGEGDHLFSTLNTNGLAMAAFVGVAETPMVYDAEDDNARIDRRHLKWTPTTFSDKALSASYFGPH